MLREAVLLQQGQGDRPAGALGEALQEPEFLVDGVPVIADDLQPAAPDGAHGVCDFAKLRFGRAIGGDRLALGRPVLQQAGC